MQCDNIFNLKSLMLSIMCVLCCAVSCKVVTKPKTIYNAEYKSISRILKEAKEVDVHLDRYMCRSLVETISKRSAIEIFSLKTEEKNEILRLAITASIDLSGFFRIVSDRMRKGLSSTLKSDSALKKQLLEAIDVSPDMTAIKVILSDGKYLEVAELDSIMFAMALMLGKATSIEGYDKTENALKEGDSKEVIDILSKTSIEVVLYSYSIVRNREDIQTMSFAGAKLIDLLPEMKVNF